MKFHATYLLLAAFALPLCASALDKKKDELKHQDYAGAPIDSFWMPSLDGWTVIDDKLLVVRTRISKEYLIKINGYCPDLKFAEAIGITAPTSTVDKFEKVIVGKNACRIGEIRPIDTANMKADRKAKRKQENAK